MSLEQEIDGAWYTVGDVKTATGLINRIAGVDYTAGALFRITCSAFQTGPVTYAVQGDIVGPAVTEDMGLPLDEDIFMLETGTDTWLLENSTQWLLESL